MVNGFGLPDTLVPGVFQPCPQCAYSHFRLHKFCELLISEKAAVVLPGAVTELAVTSGADVKPLVTDRTRGNGFLVLTLSSICLEHFVTIYDFVVAHSASPGS